MRGLGAPDPQELSFLKHAEQLGLEARGDLADLVEEQRALVGALEAAGATALGSGEGPLLVTEELTLEHALGKRLAVDGDERLADTVAPEVQ